ncbi:MAG: phosphotransferase, partial [Planctomycetota bacterium]
FADPPAIDLDGQCDGFSGIADRWRASCFESVESRISELEHRYLSPASKGHLLHGDYYPGSWLKTANGFRLIDPEFCFVGPPEFDLGVMAGHQILCGGEVDFVQEVLERYSECSADKVPIDSMLLRGFAGVEILRRLLGVAQLPLSASADRRGVMLEMANALLCS